MGIDTFTCGLADSKCNKISHFAANAATGESLGVYALLASPLPGDNGQT